MLDRYFEENERHWKMMGESLTTIYIINYIQGFIEVGLISR